MAGFSHIVESRFKIIIIIFILILASPLQAEITIDNALDFLMIGELSVRIEMRLTDIDWIEDEGAAAARIEQLKAAIEKNAQDLHATFELLDLYERYAKEEEAEVLAKHTLSAFEESFYRERDEASAVRFARVTLAAGARDRYDTAYRALQSFLESGRAGQETCIIAIENRMARNDYELAKRIADFYLKVYPMYAELHYQLYLISFEDNLLSALAKTVQASAEKFLDEQNDLYIDTDNVEGFVYKYLEDLDSKIDNASLMRAIELDPSNYKYLLSAAVFRAMTHIFSKTFIQHVSTYVEGESIAKILRQADPGLLEELRSFLTRAEENKPERDIQVYLGHAVVNMAFGRFDEVGLYALLAIGTRSDLPQGYDALILSMFWPFLDTNSTPDLATCEKAIGIYRAKIDNVGESASDYADIAGLYYSMYTQSPTEGLALEKAKSYIDKALEIDPQFVQGLIILSSCHIAMREYPKAIRILTDMPEPEDPYLKAAVFNNRGIARILNGERDAGIADLRAAVPYNDENTLNALRELGID